MERLNNDWLTNGLIDFEYKKYILLSYLKHVKHSFLKVELYPFLADMVFHYRNLLEFRNNKEHILNNFPKVMTGINLKKLEMTYKQLAEDDEIMKELSEIVEYSLPLIKSSLEEGKEIYEFVESNCEFTPVGLLPLYVDEGYVFLSQDNVGETTVYRYQLSVLEGTEEKYRGIHVAEVDTVLKGVGVTYENLKIQMIKKYKELPNPATFLVYSKITVPYKATLEPIAKRLLVKYISTT